MPQGVAGESRLLERQRCAHPGLLTAYPQTPAFAHLDLDNDSHREWPCERIRAGRAGTIMASNPRRTNGHRRRELVARVKATEDTCALCDLPVDKTLPHLDPRAGVIDEDVPVSRGGSPYQRSNCHLMHRSCNRWKSTMTLAEARAARVAKQGVEVIASTVW